MSAGMRTVPLALAFIVALAIGLAPLAAPAQSAAPLSAAEKGASDAAKALADAGIEQSTEQAEPAGFEAVARERFARTLAAIEADFPDDFRLLDAHLGQIATAGVDEKNASILFFEQLTALRRKYAYKMIEAPTAAHAAILGRLAAFYDQVFAAEGPLVCGRFAHEGTGALFELGLGQKYAGLIDLQSAAYFAAVAAAFETPEYSGIAGRRDWNIVLETMIRAGMPRSYVEAISSGRGGDPDLCPAYSALFRGTGVLNTVEGSRIRADLAKNLVGY
jgi:hypothetical protein